MDLQQFTRLLKKTGDLLVVDEAVDPCLEIAALSALSVDQQGPALLFARPRGSRFPVLINAFASPRRLALALNQTSLEDFGVKACGLLQQPQSNAVHDIVVCGEPPCREVVRSGAEAHFQLLPQITLWPGDAGPCLTAAVVATRHPETGQVNAGIYRMQIIDDFRATLGWHPGSGAHEHFAAAKRRERPLGVAVILGAPPAVTLAASFPLPADRDEFQFAAHFCQPSLTMARCVTMDLPVPADSQIVLEGFADPEQAFLEGPFTNHTGWQTAPRPCAVFQLKSISHRSEPFFQAIAAGPPPSESCWMAKAFESVLRRQITTGFAEVHDISLPLEGIFQNFCFISVKHHCAEPIELLAALLKTSCLQRFRFLVAVDEAVDVGDSSKVLWRIGNCVQPGRDIRILKGPLAPWHDSPTPGHGAKVLVDATRKNHHQSMPGYPDPAFKQRIQNLWRTIQKEA